MPAHNPVNKDREYEMHILVIEKKRLEKIPDGHAHIRFEWHGGDRTWRIEGLQEPQTMFDDPKHNWDIFEKRLPKGQGETILRLLEWVHYLSQDK